MSIHKYDDNMLPDSEFIKGEYSLLVKGNKCRLLDGGRTTGFIEEVQISEGMFRWRITKYEDEGKCWDLPVEEVIKFQFEKNSDKLEEYHITEISHIVNKYKDKITIEANQNDKIVSESEISIAKEKAICWLKENSLLLKNKERLDLSANEGSEYLYKDLKKYMEYLKLEKEEKMTADSIVLNPNSGEWIKGMCIVLAEMGLVPYRGKEPRTKDVFKGIGSKENRRRYIVNRLGFIRAYFQLLDISSVALYRGMSSEGTWSERDRTFLHMTFSVEVAKAFSNFENNKYKTFYMIKATLPVDKIFMTYLETSQMNEKYKEAEALILYDEELKL
ncbi:hypothetical protein PV797_01965 [Clostridiaceae bacterium M8S5]|nr:hypothetical protein PV797_01965 [Clostridiaceae bacterium M8S5]